jgi:hypothetical protein
LVEHFEHVGKDFIERVFSSLCECDSLSSAIIGVDPTNYEAIALRLINEP